MCFISYNSRVFGLLWIDFCKSLLSQYFVGDKLPILCNPENFVLRENSYKIGKRLPGFHLVINPVVKETHCKVRARHSMFIAVPKKLKNSIENVSPGYWRLQAMKIKTGNENILVINSYFPTDHNINEAELLETVRYI